MEELFNTILNIQEKPETYVSGIRVEYRGKPVEVVAYNAIPYQEIVLIFDRDFKEPDELKVFSPFEKGEILWYHSYKDQSVIISLDWKEEK